MVVEEKIGIRTCMIRKIQKSNFKAKVLLSLGYLATDTMEKGLSELTDVTRIDLYNTTRGIILGEMTIYPEGGRPNSPSFDKVFNKWLGDQWTLPQI